MNKLKHMLAITPLIIFGFLCVICIGYMLVNIPIAAATFIGTLLFAIWFGWWGKGSATYPNEDFVENSVESS